MNEDPEAICRELPPSWEEAEISEEESLEGGFTFTNLVSNADFVADDICPTQFVSAGLDAGGSFVPVVAGPAILTINGGRLNLTVCDGEPAVVKIGGGDYVTIEVGQVVELGPNDAVLIDPAKRLVLQAPSDLETLVSGHAVDLGWASGPMTVVGCLGIKCIGKG